MDICPPNVHESFRVGQAGDVMIRCKPNVTLRGFDNESYSCHAPVYLNDGGPGMITPFRQIRLEPLTIRVATMTHDSFVTDVNLLQIVKSLRPRYKSDGRPRDPH